MTEQWDFVLAAYAVTGAGTLAMLLLSCRAMRRAEARAESIGRGEGV